MRIMRVVELELLSQKEKLEFELEELLNRESNISTDERVNKVLELLDKQTKNLSSLQLWSSYMTGVAENNKTEKR